MSANPETLTQPTADSNSHYVHFGMSLEPSVVSKSGELQSPYRDVVVQNLLGTDYDYAKQLGLLDAFYLNSDTGEDGLQHVLTGTVATGPTGAKIPAGFHHEPSALDADTYVDRSHLENAGHDRLKHYREFPFEPYQAHVVIEGLKKMSVHTDRDGNKKIGPASSNMFPKEYDPFTVLKTVVDARNNRDPAQDKMLYGQDKILTEGSSLMLDGKTPMRIRMILDEKTQKIISAYPARPKQAGLMNLQPTEVMQHLGLR